MSRNTRWRKEIPDTVSWRQDQALNTTIYIVREVGPTAFLLKEEEEEKPFRTFLGDPHTCTCPIYRKEKDICKHIAWLLLKKFKLPRTNQASWQYGLVEREVNELLRGILNKLPKKQLPAPAADKPNGLPPAADGRPALEQRAIDEDDVCPICQEELLAKHLPVTYCKYGCGNSIHIKCMKVWADHQEGRSADKVIRCPVCREDFGPIEYLKAEYFNSEASQPIPHRKDHLGTTCRECGMSPISGNCYRCTVCSNFYFCKACFNQPTHSNHAFEFRQKTTQRWRPAPRNVSLLPTALVNNLENRELTEGDFDMLLQLDSLGERGDDDSQVPEEVIQRLPTQRVKDHSNLTGPGHQCRVCLRPYSTGQLVKRLPCRHKFHMTCIDNWLLHQKSCCPIDGQAVWNGILEPTNRRAQTQQLPQRRNAQSTVSNDQLELNVPGIGLRVLPYQHGPRVGTTNTPGGVRATSGVAGLVGENVRPKQGLSSAASLPGQTRHRLVGLEGGRTIGHTGSDPDLIGNGRLRKKGFRGISVRQRSHSAGRGDKDTPNYSNQEAQFGELELHNILTSAQQLQKPNSKGINRKGLHPPKLGAGHLADYNHTGPSSGDSPADVRTLFVGKDPLNCPGQLLSEISLLQNNQCRAGRRPTNKTNSIPNKDNSGIQLSGVGFRK